MQHLVPLACLCAIACGDPGPGQPGPLDPIDAPGDPVIDAASDATPDAPGTAPDAPAAAPGVACGAETCSSPRFCQICEPTNPASARSCQVATAPGCGTNLPEVRQSCEGDEDCAPGEWCQMFEGSIATYVRCFASEIGARTCRTGADCPAQTPSCEPYMEGYAILVCR